MKRLSYFLSIGASQTQGGAHPQNAQSTIRKKVMTYNKYNPETNSTEDDDEEYYASQAAEDAKTDEEREAEAEKLQAEAEKWCAENQDKLEF